MKRLLLVVLACYMQAGMIFAQTKASIKSNGRQLLDVVNEIQKQINKQEFNPNPCFRHCKPVYYTAKNEILDTVLVNIFKDQPLTYALDGDHLVIFPRSVKGHVTDEFGQPLEYVDVQGN